MDLFINRTAASLSVVVGEHQLSATNSSVRQTLNVQNIYVHQLYDSVTLRNDIALMKLARNITFSADVQPACLPVVGDLYQGRKCQCSGWGKLNSCKYLC